MSTSGNGRYVFFLHPHSVVQDDLARAMIERNIHAVLLRNPASTRLILSEYPDACLFVHIDALMNEDEWIDYITSLTSNPRFGGLTIAVVSSRSQEKLQRDIMPRLPEGCAAVSYAKFNTVAVLEKIERVVNPNGKTPQRTGLRGRPPGSLKVRFAFRYDGANIGGPVSEISFVGLTFHLDDEQNIPAGTPIDGGRVSMSAGKRIAVNGRIAGNHGDDRSLHVMLFNDETKTEARNGIYDVIQSSIQTEAEELILSRSEKPRLVTRVPQSELYRSRRS